MPIWRVAGSEYCSLVTSSLIHVHQNAQGLEWCWRLHPGVSLSCTSLMFGLGEGLPYCAPWVSPGKGQRRPDQCVHSLPRSSSKVKKGVVTQGRLDWMMWAWKKVAAKKNPSSSRASSEPCRSSSFSNPCLLISPLSGLGQEWVRRKAGWWLRSWWPAFVQSQWTGTSSSRYRSIWRHIQALLGWHLLPCISLMKVFGICDPCHPSSWLQSGPDSQLWEEFPFCAKGILWSVQCCAMSSVEFAYSMMYSVLVKLVDPFHLFWPDLTLTFTAIHFITEGRIMY